MEESTNKKKTLKIPEYVKVLQDIGGGQVIAMAKPELLREQDVNANIMKPEAFRQLTENIKKKGQLESLPFCALTEKGIEIVSGHHRKRAAVAAQIDEIPFILDITGLTRSQIAAKQIAHNAINGDDDKRLLKEIVKMIKDVDDMIESFIGNDVIKLPEEELEKLIAPKLDFDWKTIVFMFLPHQLDNLEKLVNSVEKADYYGVAELKQYEKLVKELSKYQKTANISNIGAAIHRLIETAIEHNNIIDKEKDWVSLSTIFGGIAVPSKEIGERLHRLTKKFVEEKKIDEKRKWETIKILLDNYEKNIR